MSRRQRWLLGIMAVLVLVALVRALTIRPAPARPALAGAVPQVWAHQGASGHAPENTMESFRLAVQMGADVLDSDLAITKDGVLILSHDETVDRMTGAHGRVADLTLAEVQKLDAGWSSTNLGGKNWRGQGLRFPALDEFFAEFAPLDGGRLRFSLEIKSSSLSMAEPLWALIQKYRLEDRVIVHSFLQESMDRFRRVSGGRVATSGARTEMYAFAGYWKTFLAFLWQPRMDLFAIPTRSGPLRTDTASLITTAHRQGVKVAYWTIDDEAEMRRLLSLGADAIFSNYPDRLLKVIRDMGLRK